MRKFYEKLNCMLVMSLMLMFLLIPGCNDKNIKKTVGSNMIYKNNSSSCSLDESSECCSSVKSISSVESAGSNAKSGAVNHKKTTAGSSAVTNSSKAPDSNTDPFSLYRTPSDDNGFFTGSELMSNLTYRNSGFMGDNDGPAYVVYSKRGYNRASMDVMLSELRMNTVRKSDGLYLNAFIFLEIDSGDSRGNSINNADAGLMYSGGNYGRWHLFHYINKVSPTSSQLRWRESSKDLPAGHNYRLVLDSSKSDGLTTLSAIDLSDGNKEVDSIQFEFLYSLKDGSNTSFYQDYAIDYPDNVKFGSNGDYSIDPTEITLYNTDQNIYMRKIIITNAMLGNQAWSRSNSICRCMWPDRSNSKINYPVVIVRSASFDTDLVLDLDMNRH